MFVHARECSHHVSQLIAIGGAIAIVMSCVVAAGFAKVLTSHGIVLSPGNYPETCFVRYPQFGKQTLLWLRSWCCRRCSGRSCHASRFGTQSMPVVTSCISPHLFVAHAPPLSLLKLTWDSALYAGCPPAFPLERTAGAPSPRSD